MAVSAPWTTAEDALLRAFIEQGLDSAEIVAKFADGKVERTQKAIQRRRERLGLHMKVAPSPFQRCGKEVVIQGDTLNVFDLHCPFHDAAFVNECIDLALKWGIKKATVGGDAVDFAGFSKYGRQLGTEAIDELRAAEQALNTLAECFDEVGYIPGGHEMRLARMVGFLLDIQKLMQLWVSRKNIRISRKEWLTVESGGECYMVGHPRNYSRNATYVAKEIATNKGRHTILGHDHLVGMTRDKSGHYWAIDAGICADPKRLAYLDDQLTTHPEVAQGACIVKDGMPILVTPHNLPLLKRMRFAA